MWICERVHTIQSSRGSRPLLGGYFHATRLGGSRIAHLFLRPPSGVPSFTSFMSLLTHSLSENRRTLALAMPIIAGHVSQMLMGWADTIMVGRIGIVPLAASAFANTILAVPLVFGFGLLSSVSVRASIAHGSGDNGGARSVLRSGLELAMLAGLLIGTLISLSVPILPQLGQKPEVNAACVNYLLLCGWSILPVLITTASKNFAEALSKPWIPFWMLIGAVLLNVFLNWILIYGNLGAPAMGLDGAGVATLIARILSAIAITAYAFSGRAFAAKETIIRKSGQMASLFKLGLPVGTMHLSEVGGFAMGSLMMGWLGVNALAAHQIALTCAATAFMFPLGLAQAVSVRVGQARGSGFISQCKAIIWGAQGLTVVTMAIFTCFFILAGVPLAAVFVEDSAVVALTASLLVIAGIFQIVDGIQVVSSGALRGFEDVKAPMLIGGFSYWVVALPISYLLAFTLGVGPLGVWIGLSVGLGVAAVALTSRLVHRLKIVQASSKQSHRLLPEN